MIRILLSIVLATALCAAAETADRPQVIHAIVVLCDNDNQRIVPVPAALGNGQDTASNLYWGARFGVKSFFRRSSHWETIPVAPATETVIRERLLFKLRNSHPPVYLLAEAYDGAEMVAGLKDYFAACAGRLERTVKAGPKNELSIAAGGSAAVVCFVGHDGLMEHTLDNYPTPAAQGSSRTAWAFACQSRRYFLDGLKAAGCREALLTTGNMAPEAYVLDAAARAWASGRTPAGQRLAAARAYETHQKLKTGGAERLFVAVDPGVPAPTPPPAAASRKAVRTK